MLAISVTIQPDDLYLPPQQVRNHLPPRQLDGEREGTEIQGGEEGVGETEGEHGRDPACAGVSKGVHPSVSRRSPPLPYDNTLPKKHTTHPEHTPKPNTPPPSYTA